MRIFERQVLRFIATLILLLLASAEHDDAQADESISSSSQTPSSYKLSDLVLLRQVMAQIETDYLEPKRIVPTRMLDKALEHIQDAEPSLLFEWSTDHRQLTGWVDGVRQSWPIREVKTPGDVVTTLTTILPFVEEHLQPSAPLKTLEYAAINGILGTLDSQSVLSPATMSSTSVTTAPKVTAGLGLTLSIAEDYQALRIMDVLPGGSAEEGGVRAGDVLLEVDGEPVTGMSLNDVVGLLRGAPGSNAHLLVQRPGEKESRSFDLRRTLVAVASIKPAVLDSRIGWVQIRSFDRWTSRLLAEALHQMEAEGPLAGLVLDLRQNSGGPFQQAIEVADLFLKRGNIVTTVQANGRSREANAATAYRHDHFCPLVVIVDSVSAAGAEIVASALRDNNRAVILGERTFGQGRIGKQYSYPDGEGLRLTIAEWLTPGGQSVEGVGLLPDIQLVPVSRDGQLYHFGPEPGFDERDLPDGQSGPQQIQPGNGLLEPIQYVVPSVSPTGEAAEADGAGSRSVSRGFLQQEDFQVTFARDLLHQAGRPTRTGTLSAARSFLLAQKATQNSELQAWFAKDSVDWSQGMPGQPHLETVFTLGNASPVFVAGQQVTVQVTVKNDGKDPAYRVRAKTKSELGSLTGLEFMLGRIDPGSSRSATCTVTIWPGLFQTAAPVRLEVLESGDRPAGHVDIVALVDGHSPPTYAHSLVLVDDGSGHSRGNGDGKPQAGEAIDIVLMAKNVGEQEVLDSVAELNGAALPTGAVRRLRLTSLQPGNWGDGRFHIKLPDTLEAGVLEFDLKLGSKAMQAKQGAHVSLMLEKSVGEPVEVVREVKRVRGAAALPVRNVADAASPAFAQVAGGAVVQVIGRMPGWQKIQIPWTRDTMAGWVAEAALEPASDAALSGENVFSPMFQQSPPAIVLSPPDRIAPAGAQSVELHGKVRDDGAVRRILVRANAHKVFMWSSGGREGGAEGNGTEVPFTARVPLDKGVNIIQVEAFDDAQNRSWRTIGVYLAP